MSDAAADVRATDQPQDVTQPPGGGGAASAAPPPTSPAGNRVLTKMLDRLFAALVNGPGLNCRPHRSRQRVDLAQLSKLADVPPEEVLRRLLGPKGEAVVKARVPQPKRSTTPTTTTTQPLAEAPEAIEAGEAARGPGADAAEPPAVGESPHEEEDAGRAAEERAWADQNTLLTKLHVIAEDARTYEQDTGVHVLNVGFPLLSLPPGSFSAPAGSLSRRILAPVAFIPVTLTLKRGSIRSVEIACRGEGIDLVTPNSALLAWIQQQAGQPVDKSPELFPDERGEDPWREIGELVRHVCKMLDLAVPKLFEAPSPFQTEARMGKPNAATRVTKEPSPPPSPGVPGEGGSISPTSSPATVSIDNFHLDPASRADEAGDKPAILTSAVLGLFPMANQGLLRDMQEMAHAPESLRGGPVESFVRVDVSLEPPPESDGKPDVQAEPLRQRARRFGEERLVAQADPCQSRAVRLARQSRGLVIHGPPGTGKSQTITNIIGDHLARGLRVLFVCDKRTALDVVANRLRHMGLGRLVAIVHDPQRDQRELYRSLRQQLEELADATTDPRASAKLQKSDEELQRLHEELAAYRAALARPDPQTHLSFHDLVGQWLATETDHAITLNESHLAAARLHDLDEAGPGLREILHRAADVEFARNPWREAVGVALPELLARPADFFRAKVNEVTAAAQEADATLQEGDIPFAVGAPFAPGPDLKSQADARVVLADEIDRLRPVLVPEAMARWAGMDLPSLMAVRARITETGPFVSAMKGAALDAELLAVLVEWQRPLPSLQQLADRRSALQKYADAYNTWHTWLSRIHQSAPNARFETLIRWITADERTVAAAYKALAAAAPLAERARTTPPLDPELLAQYRRQPFDVPQLLRWQAALDTYLPKARSLLSFLHGSKKRAAAPATEFFGLAVSADSAQRVRDFLVGLRLRLEVLEALVRALGPAAFTELPADAELFAAFADHHGTLAASADMQRQALPHARPGPETTPITDMADLVHRLIAPDLEPVTPLFAEFELFPNPQNTARLKAFYQGLTVRLLLQDFHHRVLGDDPPERLMGDDGLERSIASHTAFIDLVLHGQREPALEDVADALALAASQGVGGLDAFGQALRHSPARAAALAALEQRLLAAQLFSADWLAGASRSARSGQPFADMAGELESSIDTLEGVVRVQTSLAKLQPGARAALTELVEQSAGERAGWAAVRKVVLAQEITRKLAADPMLQNVDGRRIRTSFERYRALETQKRNLVRDAILDHWIGQQQERLLADTGTRLNSMGAELKRRLTLRGERAMRLRQVVAAGRRIEGGDPLFDLCPVWMVSPETAAQLFPREPVFDVVLFDEASQCRLEEALPVLTRGRRVVIAGDPKQLPPTRFFESAVSQSEDEEAETDQELFEQQQGEVEDLLAAALGLEIEQCYLDVHYRSRHASLIGFSNEHFYGSRLQPIPGRAPAPRAPVTLHRAAGVYEKRRNEAEADRVCEIVRELLGRDEPPSIGIACFNLQQRELILEKLDELAEQDEGFGQKLAAARTRTGAGSFQGLFVKNLENVQGDERDHIIISTTYGPDPKGRFYRRFGPLGMAGGGRRLNVLVTRARDEVHLVTSIPPEAYRSLPPLEAGRTAGGAWLLFAYLKYAEDLARQYGRTAPAEPSAASESKEMTAAAAGSNGDATATATTAGQVESAPLVSVRPTRAPSPFAESVAQRLSNDHGARAEVYWGNDGFCVDVALHHPQRPGELTLGVLCDVARFTPAEDPTEWDVFRTGVLESQGWRLHRVWSPHFFRDPAGTLRSVIREADEVAAADEAEQGFELRE